MSRCSVRHGITVQNIHPRNSTFHITVSTKTESVESVRWAEGEVASETSCKSLTLFHIMRGLVGWLDVAGSKLVVGVVCSSEKLVPMCQTARCQERSLPKRGVSP